MTRVTNEELADKMAVATGPAVEAAIRHRVSRRAESIPVGLAIACACGLIFVTALAVILALVASGVVRG